MAPHELRRPFKRPAISDQQKRRDLSLLRQSQSRRDAQDRARRLASTIISFQSEQQLPDEIDPIELDVPESEPEPEHESPITIYDVRQASKLRGAEARRWFAKQLMLPEWMIDVPPNLATDWYVFARPAGKRCFVVSSNGITISRLRNGILLHRFPSALPSGSRKNSSSQSYSILDCIFHEPDQTYYVIDMVCWAGFSLYECTAEFRFFWLNSKLLEVGACDAPSTYHKFRFSTVPVYDCDQQGLETAYTGATAYIKDGLLFFNKHAHYQLGNTPLALVWKDEKCSQYVIDTDSKGEIPNQQQLVLELLDDGRLATSDDPAIIFGCLTGDFIQKTGLRAGNLLRFAVNDGGLCFVDGRLERADLHYLGPSNRARTFADSYSKIMFQYIVRHSPLKIEHILSSIGSPDGGGELGINDEEMVG
ncbi:OLC1v1028848C1 [Oldenlandia corymbosa var. corymbosa]|uniref:Snurportin-1 n=1 Tax=Oldenlandia corymbosa var. corymbosa TaxID=529605 RepID=A0AAV1CCW3_OLDCO|nr:OLC1v1028848C1 [Oldenlandia corymbosa var. corymbosa]